MNHTSDSVNRPAQLHLLLQRLRDAQTYSEVFVAAVHDILQSGEAGGRYSAFAAAWESHDPRWAPLMNDYRAFFATSPHADLLMQGRLREYNANAQTGNTYGVVVWPYVSPAPESQAPQGLCEPWPLTYRSLGVTQQGLLGQSAILFAHLNEMVREWQTALKMAPPTPLPVTLPSSANLQTADALPLVNLEQSQTSLILAMKSIGNGRVSTSAEALVHAGAQLARDPVIQQRTREIIELLHVPEHRQAEIVIMPEELAHLGQQDLFDATTGGVTRGGISPGISVSLRGSAVQAAAATTVQAVARGNSSRRRRTAGGNSSRRRRTVGAEKAAIAVSIVVVLLAVSIARTIARNPTLARAAADRAARVVLAIHRRAIVLGAL